MHEVVVKKSPIHGMGVFAVFPIEAGEIIMPIDDDRVVTDDNPVNHEDGEMEYHCDYLRDGLVVLMQEPERHINHSCMPNSYVRTIDGVRYVVALRTILPQDEITNDFCINGGGDTVWTCNCCHVRCRKTIHSNFFELSLELQSAYLPLLDRWFVDENSVEVKRLRKQRNNVATTNLR